MFRLIQFPMILKCIPYITCLEFLEDPEQFLVMLLSIDQYFISITEPFPCLYWINLTLKLLKQLLLEVYPKWAEVVVWDLIIIASQYDFPSTARGNATFLVSSDTNFFYHPFTYSNSLESSCFLTKWLLLHKKQLLADICGLLGSYSPSLMTSKHSFPCLHLLAMFRIGHNWTQPVLPEAVYFVVFVSQLSLHIVYQPWHFAKVVQWASLQTQLMLMLMKI